MQTSIYYRINQSPTPSLPTESVSHVSAQLAPLRHEQGPSTLSLNYVVGLDPVTYISDQIPAPHRNPLLGRLNKSAGPVEWGCFLSVPKCSSSPIRSVYGDCYRPPKPVSSSRQLITAGGTRLLAPSLLGMALPTKSAGVSGMRSHSPRSPVRSQKPDGLVRPGRCTVCRCAHRPPSLAQHSTAWVCCTAVQSPATTEPPGDAAGLESRLLLVPGSTLPACKEKRHRGLLV